MSEEFRDVGAESFLLGCLLNDPGVLPDVSRVVTSSDFYDPKHGLLFAVMTDLRRFDPQTVLAEVMRRGLLQEATGGQGGVFLHSLMARFTSSGMAVAHAEQVRAAAVRRGFQTALERAVQAAEDPAAELADVAVRLQAACEDALTERVMTVAAAMTAKEFLVGEDRYDWVVPGLIERHDRTIVTGGEGTGKSTWLRQMAVCIAGGLHPVSLRPVRPADVLLVDLENSRVHIRRRLRPLMEIAERAGHDPGDRLRLEHRPAGIDLGKPADAAWLSDLVGASKPALLVVGPLYRMHASSVDKEDAARQLVAAIDQIRVRHRCAVMLEAHAPHGKDGVRWWRPAGSSLFMRWPEFGVGLQKDGPGRVEVLPWRGHRDERDWPRYLYRGGQGGWPWVPEPPAVPRPAAWRFEEAS